MPKHVGLDLGTSNTRMFIKGKGIVLRSPTVVTMDKSKEEVIALGSEAKKMIGKTPAHIEAYRPIRDGVVADHEVAAMMIHEYFKRTETLSLLNRPVVLTSAPINCTEVEKSALENSIFAAGAKAVGVVGSSIAAAVGAGLNINDPRGCMIVDIGGGMTQVAVISSGRLIVSRAAKLGGNKFDGAIINSLRQKRDLCIGEMTAELLKVKIGSALPGADRGLLDVSGLSDKLKCAKTVRIGSEDIFMAIGGGLDSICRTILSALDSAPPEIAGDISSRGLMLVGGGANIYGIKELINKRTGLRVTVAQNPMDCECIGLAKLIETPAIIPGGILYKNR